MKLSKAQILERCNAVVPNTLMQTLDIRYVDVGDDFLVAEMPVTPKVHQPDGILHGGAMVALAESVGSAACFVFLDTKNFSIRGLEINANHVRSIKDGKVFAKASFIHKGRTTQVWQIEITNQKEQLISMCKLTTIALPK
ncbi:PaaI family thioesterase [Psychroflexus salis]|uniref:Thioesterase n=1 Tax=Psychroflexus salis TaxID=1526574 RepID=A0A917E9K8_9FLAO|nr:hotdog fold thioesterase [Psychroflexus salis]GGE17053.1 thioesterase [Psychroflexus salis]